MSYKVQARKHNEEWLDIGEFRYKHPASFEGMKWLRKGWQVRIVGSKEPQEVLRNVRATLDGHFERRS